MTDTIQILTVPAGDELPPSVDDDRLARFLHRALHPFNDTLEDIGRGIAYARSTEPGRGGHISLALEGDRLWGAVVVLATGMSGYVPSYLLLFVAVDPDGRGKGIGGRLVDTAARLTEGDLALHVEYDNPAKRLYERLGFRSKYAEMRYQP